MAINYKLFKDPISDNEISVRKTDDNSDQVLSIPLSEGNTDYQEYLAWVAEGNTADPADVIDEWPNIRAKRDRLLTESDWTQAADSPLTASKKTKWATYRQELRDLPAEQSSKTKLSDITWPTKP